MNTRTSIPLPVVDHAGAAAAFGHDVALASWHDTTVWGARLKRDRASRTVPEWEALREAASRIKEHTLGQLDEYLEEFERNAQANGVQVHWARDGAEHNRIVLEILDRHGARRLVKSKSMLTEECHLNPFLEQHGVEVVDTDLGERIVQLAGEPPSHIVTPAIHVTRQRIGELFSRLLGTEPGATDPQYLTEAARQHLRAKFLAADAALTGVNFALADTGGFVVCTNEGNADLGVHLAPVHIASMGIEKVIPRAAQLGIFLRLLARSATGQPSTVFTSHFHRPRAGTELHVIIVDNGRTVQLAREHFRASLKCIRCGACMNTCPVYRRSGGHSYGTTVPGPIGSVLAPNLDLTRFSTLPFASTLCGSCTDVCPVKIDLHEQLYRWRQLAAEAGALPPAKRRANRALGRVLSHPRLFRAAGRMLRRGLRSLPRAAIYTRWNEWGRARELPEPPRQSFREWYLENRNPHEQPPSHSAGDPPQQAGAVNTS
jgi:L-lactate dehydrogenase complex protein LldF